jgi:hypothetical protein
MKSLFRNITVFLVAILLLNSFFACYNARRKYAHATSVVTDSIIQPTVFYPKTFDEQGRLYYYIKVFGVLKYFLSEKPPQDVNALFLEHYQTIKNAPDKKHFNAGIQNLILSIHPNIRSMLNENASIDWTNDSVYFDHTTAQYISAVEHIFRQDKKKSFYVKQDILGLVDIVNDEEIPYFNDSFPDESLRVWGLAEYWNYVNYFWIHKKLMDNNWDSVLYVKIPDFIQSHDRVAYFLTIHNLVAYTNSTYIYFQGEEDTVITGNYVPNIYLAEIDNQFVVKRLKTDRTLIPSDTLLHVGDIIYSINGRILQPYYDSLQHCFSVSNSWTKSYKLCPYLVSSFSKTNEVIINRNGIIDTLEMLFLPRNEYTHYERNEYGCLKKDETVQNMNGLGYLHINKLSPYNMQKNIQALQQYKQIILDMRGYPCNKVFIGLTNQMLPFGTSYFSSTYPDIVDIGKIRLAKGLTLGFRNRLKNKNIVILVDETTISLSALLVMALQQNFDVKVIGTPTGGADIYIVSLKFPGNIQTILTGAGIVYPDGSQTQRCGIKIDYPVHPTIDDYINTQDPILEYAIQYFNDKTKVNNQ